MCKVYGYARVSTQHQRLDRQIENLKAEFPNIIIYKEHYTGTTTQRPSWQRLLSTVKDGDTIVFDSVSRMSRNSAEGFNDYKMLYDKKVNLVFLREPHINTEVFKQTAERSINININSGNEAVDKYLTGNISLINQLLLSLCEQQIILAFQQAEKEVTDIHTRIAEGIREAKRRGSQIGLSKGSKLTTKKSVDCKKTIMDLSKDFNGNLSDAEILEKYIHCSRNTYYTYKRQLKEEL